MVVSESGRTVNIKRSTNYKMFSKQVDNVKVDIVSIRDNLVRVKVSALNRQQ